MTPTKSRRARALRGRLSPSKARSADYSRLTSPLGNQGVFSCLARSRFVPNRPQTGQGLDFERPARVAKAPGFAEPGSRGLAVWPGASADRWPGANRAVSHFGTTAEWEFIPWIRQPALRGILEPLWETPALSCREAAGTKGNLPSLGLALRGSTQECFPGQARSAGALCLGGYSAEWLRRVARGSQ